jgi:general secretion pathway protein M
MERLRQLQALLELWFGKLSPRERIMVTLAGVAVALFVIFMISFRLQSGIRARELRIEEKTKALAQVGALAGGYRRVQADRGALEARLKGAHTPLLSLVSQTGTALGIEVTDLRPVGAPAEVDGVTEESVEVNLPRIDLVRLSKMVQQLEKGQGLVKVRRLRLSTRNDDPKLVDAMVVVSTYSVKG